METVSKCVDTTPGRYNVKSSRGSPYFGLGELVDGRDVVLEHEPQRYPPARAEGPTQLPRPSPRDSRGVGGINCVARASAAPPAIGKGRGTGACATASTSSKARPLPHSACWPSSSPSLRAMSLLCAMSRTGLVRGEGLIERRDITSCRFGKQAPTVQCQLS